MTEFRLRAWASIDTQALRKNLSIVHQLCPDASVIPVIKANAYGHGMQAVAAVFSSTSMPVQALAVATMMEAAYLREQSCELPLLVLNGFTAADELTFCLENRIAPVLHCDYQVELLTQQLDKGLPAGRHQFWLKFNSGMNRLGMRHEACAQAYRTLRRCKDLDLVLMSHLAWADEPDSAAARQFSGRQLAVFEALRAELAAEQEAPVRCSVAASSGICSLPESRLQIVRPGVMLYGSSPLSNQSAAELGLLPVMTLSARLLAINTVAAGEHIGYGATFRCEQETRVGVVSIGYGDGYPRAVGSGTPVLVKASGGVQRSRLLGRVSMDLITIDLSDIAGVRVGDEVTLWGEGLPVDEIARAAGTIAYELLCKVTQRIPRYYL